MGIFRVEKKNLEGEVVASYLMQNTVLDGGLEYLCGNGNNFNTNPFIGVGSSDITPDTNQIGLIAPVEVLAATYTPGTSTAQNLLGDTQFMVSTHFGASDAIGDLTELSYYMNNGAPLNRTLFQTPGTLDTRFPATSELDQQQTTDISNVSNVYGQHYFDQTFTVAASGGASSVANLTEISLSLASSGNPAYPLTVQVCADNSGVPGTVIGSTTIAAFSEPVQRWRIASFASPVAVTANSLYHIVVSCPNTDVANCYDIFGSIEDEYTYGRLSMSTNGGTTYAAVSPAQDLGFITYYSESGATAHTYVITAVQFEKETAQSASYVVTAFPENNLDSTSTSEGTVRLTVPQYGELPGFTSALKVYKNVGGIFGLIGTIGTTRQYFYDNGTTAPNTTFTPPASSVISTPTGLSVMTDTANGGPLQLGQNKYYKIAAVMQGTLVQSVPMGPFQYNGPSTPNLPFYTSAYTTTPTPLYGAELETAASSEITLTAPASAAAPFTEYFTAQSLDPTKWNISNNNSDYFSLVTPSSTGESQLQMNAPAGVPFVVSSTRKARPGQSYYLNVKIPFTTQSIPYNVYSSNGTPSVNPIYTNSAPNRVPIFSFVNPSNIQSQNNDKRLSLEYGFYNGFRFDDMVTQGNTSANAIGPYFALYDNCGDVFFFSTSDITPSHSDSSYSFRIDVLLDRSMQINILDGSSHTFKKISSSVTTFDFKNQYNGSHTSHFQSPGPATQTTNHFVIPSNYSFAIGNPSNDPYSFAQANYIAKADSTFTIAGTNPTVPVPAIAMTVNGSVVSNTGGFSSIITWNPVPGARKYRLYGTSTSGNYSAQNGSLVLDYETYYPAYAVQSTDTPSNDFQNGLVAVGNQVRNWQDIGVTFGVDAGTVMAVGGGYALGGFVGSTSYNYGNPVVPTVASAPGSAETYLLLLTGGGQKALFTFMGGGVEVVGETGPDRGIANIYIDGNFVETVDFYSANRMEQQSVFSTNALTPGYHTIMVAWTGTANDFSLGTAIPLDYFHIIVPAIVDSNNLFTGNPSSTNNSGIIPFYPPTIKGSKTYNGNGPTVVVKDPQHTLDCTMTFSLVNPNL